jgi:hypothetical protein
MKVLAVVAALFLLTAQKPPAACGVVTPAEISAAIGMNAGAGHESDVPVPNGVLKGQPMTSCTWPVGQGTVSIKVVRAPSGAKLDAAIAEMERTTKEAQATLKSQGWSLEESSIGVAKCLTSLSPQKVAGTMCVGKVKGMGLTILANLGGTKLAPAKLKAFFDAASKHL